MPFVGSVSSWASLQVGSLGAMLKEKLPSGHACSSVWKPFPSLTRSVLLEQEGRVGVGGWAGDGLEGIPRAANQFLRNTCQELIILERIWSL